MYKAETTQYVHYRVNRRVSVSTSASLRVHFFHLPRQKFQAFNIYNRGLVAVTTVVSAVYVAVTTGVSMDVAVTTTVVLHVFQ